MRSNIHLLSLMLVLLVACSSPVQKHDQENEHNHEDVKIQLTSYSSDFEVFAETDPFAKGEPVGILAHFSLLKNFKAIESGQMKARLIVEGKEVSETLEAPDRKGIYKFTLTPETSGKGQLIFTLKTDTGNFDIIVPDIEVFADHHDAIHTAEDFEFPTLNTIVFTKEQSWKIDFRTEIPTTEPFGQVIKTTARMQSTPEDEVILSAKTSGTVSFLKTNLFSGGKVSQGNSLFTISSDNFAENNSSVRFAEAENNYEKAKADFGRLTELYKDKIVSEKDLLESKTNFENAKAVYTNLKTNFSAKGQSVKSTINGYVNQVLVTNGQFVEAGQALVSLAKNRTLLLQADVPQKYAAVLNTINSAIIRIPNEDKTYTLEELSGKILAYGRNTNSSNSMIPLSLQIKNPGYFTSGSIVEIFLKTVSGEQVLTVPNQAILEDQGTYFVFVQVHPELFEKREVRIGITDGLRTELKSGITAAELLVTKGAVMVKLAQSSGALDAHSGHVH